MVAVALRGHIEGKARAGRGVLKRPAECAACEVPKDVGGLH